MKKYLNTLAAMLLLTFFAATHVSAVNLSTGSTYTLSNNLVSVSVDTASGGMTSFTVGGQQLAYTQSWWMTQDGGVGTGEGIANQQNLNPNGPLVGSVVDHGTSAIREFKLSHGEGSEWRWGLDAHWAMRDGEPGYYCWVYITHNLNNHSYAGLGQMLTRVSGQDYIDGWADTSYVSGWYKKPIADATFFADYVSQPFDATFIMADGSIYTKYEQSDYMGPGKHRYMGMTGSGRGIWLLKDPYNEHLAGGYYAQENTTHEGGMMRHLHAGHFGDGGGYNEAWGTWNNEWNDADDGLITNNSDGNVFRKMYGPWFVMGTMGTEEAQEAEVSAKADELIAAWPYTWMNTPEYIKKTVTVTGQLTIAGQADPTGTAVFITDTPSDALRIGPWDANCRSYTYTSWVTNSAGDFAIKGVRPGSNYSLFAVNDQQFGEYELSGITVPVAGTVAVQHEYDLLAADYTVADLTWTPPHEAAGAEVIWQVGVPDRDSAEFMRGGGPRRWGKWSTYPSDFPAGVNYVVGQSDYAYDWNYYMGGFEGDAGPAMLIAPVINFDNDVDPLGGPVTLRVDIAGSSVSVSTAPNSFIVYLNGEFLAYFTNSTPGKPHNGQDFYRGATMGVYYEHEVTFDANRLLPTGNRLEFNLEGSGQLQNGGPGLWNVALAPAYAIMWDCIRLEGVKNGTPTPPGDPEPVTGPVPVAHWDFEEGIGNTAVSTVGGNTYTLTHDLVIPTWSPGANGFGKAIETDGTNHLAVPTGAFNPGDTPYAIGEGFTITVNFMETTDYGGVTSLLDMRGDNYLTGLEFQTGGGYAIRAQVGNPTATASWMIAGGSHNLNVWQQLAVTYEVSAVEDGSGYSEGHTSAYLNGTKIAEDAGGWKRPYKKSDVANWYIGKNFIGLIDDVKVYNEVLDPSELYSLPEYPPLAPEGTLLLHYDFENADNIALDLLPIGGGRIQQATDLVSGTISNFGDGGTLPYDYGTIFTDAGDGYDGIGHALWVENGTAGDPLVAPSPGPLAPPWTVSMWIKEGNNSSLMMPMDWSSTDTTGVGFYTQGQQGYHRMRFRDPYNPGGFTAAYQPDNGIWNEWYQFTMTYEAYDYDGSVGAYTGVQKVYINGSLAATGGACVYKPDTGPEISFGVSGFDWWLDDIKIWTGALEPKDFSATASNRDSHWDMHEGSGTSTYDLTNNAEATFIGSPEWSTDTGDGSKYSLRFTDPGVTGLYLPAYGIESPGGDLSVSVWVKVEIDNGAEQIVLRNNTGDLGLAIVVDASGNWVVRTQKMGGTDEFNGGAVSYGAWTHVVYTFDSLAGDPDDDGYHNGTAELFIDGSSMGTQAMMHQSPPGGWTLGQTLQGKVADVKFVGEVLDVVGVGELNTVATESSLTTDMAEVTSHWRFDESSGDTVDDITGEFGTLNAGTVYNNNLGSDTILMDAPSEGVVTAAHPGMNSNGSWSVAAWIDSDNGDAIAAVLYTASNDDASGIIVGWDNNTQASMHLGHNGAWDSLTTYGIDGGWQHVVWTYKANSGPDASGYYNGTGTIYVGTIEVGTKSNMKYKPSTATQYGIGAKPDGTWGMEGSIDHLVYMNDAIAYNKIRWDGELFIDQPSAPPNSMSATMVNPTDVTLAWNDASTDEGGFVIERRCTSTPAIPPLPIWTPIGEVAADTEALSDNGLTPGQSYQYRVAGKGERYTNLNVAELSGWAESNIIDVPTEYIFSISLDGSGEYDPAIAAALDPELIDLDGDFDGDGLSNRREGYFGTDPESAANAGLPSVSKINVGGSDYMQLTFTRMREGVSYEVQTSTDLSSGSWLVNNNSVPLTIGAPNLDGFGNEDGTETVTYRFDADLVTESKVFFRVVATE